MRSKYYYYKEHFLCQLVIYIEIFEKERKILHLNFDMRFWEEGGGKIRNLRNLYSLYHNFYVTPLVQQEYVLYIAASI